MEKYLPGKVFNIAEMNQPAKGCTISEKVLNGVTVFSLAADTDVSAESYPDDTLVYVYQGKVKIKGTDLTLLKGQALVMAKNTNFGFEVKEDTVLIEAVVKEGKAFAYGQAVDLNNAVPYRDGQIVNMDAAHGANMKYAVMAFDKGTGLDEHSAPGDAIVTGLEGNGIVGYEGKEYSLKAGESFRFARGGRHYVKAVGSRFRMSLLLVLA